MGAHARTRARAAPRCRALRKRMIDAPLFTPTFRRPRLCCRLIDGMNHSARSAIRDPSVPRIRVQARPHLAALCSPDSAADVHRDSSVASNEFIRWHRFSRSRRSRVRARARTAELEISARRLRKRLTDVLGTPFSKTVGAP